MALSITQTAALVGLLKPGMSVASFGYPDVIAPPELVGKLLNGRKALYRGDSQIICRRHGLAPRDIPDAHSLFGALECDLVVYDIVQERGCEIPCDLNEPWHGDGLFDVVLDVGTVEHCFNIGTAIMNMARQVKVGGVIIHENPFSCGNHGFYNLNPTWYHDFYTANGFEMVHCCLATRDGRTAEVPNTQRFKFFSEEVNVFAMARRVDDREMVFPTQTKYAKSIPVAGVSGERAADVRAIGA